MRRTFVEVLKSAKFNYKDEYDKLYHLLFDKDYESPNGGEDWSLYDYFDSTFLHFYFAGTCLSLEEFDKKYGFYFPVPGEESSIDDLILLLEYFQNLIKGFRCANYTLYRFSNVINENFLTHYLYNMAEEMGYKFSSQDGLSILVEKNAVVTAVAESNLIPEDLSYKLITYNHHSMHGDLEGKKSIILRLYNLLEARRSELHKLNPALEDDLFYIFNNFNIRHNNCDSKSKNYKPGIVSMDKEKLENWYDETYQMCLLAFMELEQADRKQKFDAIKAEIEDKLKETSLCHSPNPPTKTP